MPWRLDVSLKRGSVLVAFEGRARSRKKEDVDWDPLLGPVECKRQVELLGVEAKRASSPGFALEGHGQYTF